MRGPVADAEKSPQAGKTREEGKPLNPVGSLDEVPFATLALSTRSEQFGAYLAQVWRTPGLASRWTTENANWAANVAPIEHMIVIQPLFFPGC